MHWNLIYRSNSVLITITPGRGSAMHIIWHKNPENVKYHGMPPTPPDMSHDWHTKTAPSYLTDRSFQPFLSLILHFHFCHCLPGKMPTQPTNWQDYFLVFLTSSPVQSNTLLDLRQVLRSTEVSLSASSSTLWLRYHQQRQSIHYLHRQLVLEYRPARLCRR